MDRKEFAHKLIALGVCPFALPPFLYGSTTDDNSPGDEDEKFMQLKGEKEFVEHWLSDLLDSMENVLDKDTIVKVVENCGKACYSRHSFKQDIAAKGKGDLDKLIEAYDQNFEIWREENKVHIRYGETSPGCYCPAAKYRTPKPDDVHCECTRMTHQTIFETALGKAIKVDIAETVRRGGKTCHFIVHV
ncbi:MAG: hypothetical protein R6W90_09705 [Ignavibacteriaceae bacterium]